LLLCVFATFLVQELARQLLAHVYNQLEYAQMTRFARMPHAALACAFGLTVATSMPTQAQTTIEAARIGAPITLDGKIDDWAGIAPVTVPLSEVGRKGGDVASVEIRTAVHGDMFYMLAVWEDSEESKLHKPYRWDEASQSYKATKIGEDRFMVSFPMKGPFTANKLDGSEFTADVWYWKSQRSNPAGLAHDKNWRVSSEPFENATSFRGPDGNTVYLKRSSDAGDKLYSSVKYDAKEAEFMPRYKVNMEAQGSIADIKARGVWRNGRWYLELSRRLDTGHADDAAIPVAGAIEISFAVSNGQTSGDHSVSEKYTLKTGLGS
jgi:hypothetical protein